MCADPKPEQTAFNVLAQRPILVADSIIQLCAYESAVAKYTSGANTRENVNRL
jgi:hypothetical protein